MADSTLTESADTTASLGLTDGDDTVTGTALTLNASDDFDGLLGFDVLKLFAAGSYDTFNLDGSSFTGFEEVQLINITTTQATLNLTDVTGPIDVSTFGTGPTRTYATGTPILGGLQGDDARDQVYLSGDASATTIDLGDGSSQFVDLVDNASVTAIVGGNGSDAVYLQHNASVATIEMGGGEDRVDVRPSAWDPNITIDGGAGLQDSLAFYSSGPFRF